LFAIRFANRGAKPAGFVPVIPEMLPPVTGADKALCLPQRSSFAPFTAKSAEIRDLPHNKPP